MFLNKEKLLADRSFINNIAEAITKTDRAYLITLFESLQPDSDRDIDGQERAAILTDYLYKDLLQKIRKELLIEKTIGAYLDFNNYFADQVYEALVKKIYDEDGLIKIVDAVLTRLTSSEDGKEKVTEILDKTNDIIVEHKKKSSEPWVNIVGDVWDDNENKFKVALDWNDAFIAMLRKQGITAENESDVVEMWLKGLANQ